MSGARFERGSSYIGTATLDNKRQRVFSVVGRRGDVVSFERVRDVKNERVECYDGTEVAAVKDADGFDYVLSARVPVDVGRSFEIVEKCQA